MRYPTTAIAPRSVLLAWGLGITVLVSSLSGCGQGQDGSTLADLSWKFDYSNWTENGASTNPALLRGCDNAPTVPADPPYDTITTMRITLSDPAQQVPGVNQQYPCEEGGNGAHLSLLGVHRQIFDLTVDGLNAAGLALYRYHDPAFDLRTFVSKELILHAATGELSMTPHFGAVGQQQCPAGVSTFRYTLRAISSTSQSSTTHPGTPAVSGTTQTSSSAATQALQGTQPACRGGFSNTLVIRNIPVTPSPTHNNGYLPTDYDIWVEALDAQGNVKYCGMQSSRSVMPAMGSPQGDPVLQAGACSVSPVRSP